MKYMSKILNNNYLHGVVLNEALLFKGSRHIAQLS